MSFRLKEYQPFKHFFETYYSIVAGDHWNQCNNYFDDHEYLDHVVGNRNLGRADQERLSLVKKVQKQIENLKFPDFIIFLASDSQELKDTYNDHNGRSPQRLRRLGVHTFPKILIEESEIANYKAFINAMFSLPNIINPRLEEVKRNFLESQEERSDIIDSLFLFTPEEWFDMIKRRVKKIKGQNKKETYFRSLFDIVNSIRDNPRFFCEIDYQRGIPIVRETKEGTYIGVLTIDFYLDWINDQVDGPLPKVEINKPYEVVFNAIERFNYLHDLNKGKIRISDPKAFINAHLKTNGFDEKNDTGYANEDYRIDIRTSYKELNELLVHISKLLKPHLKGSGGSINLNSNELGIFLQKIFLRSGHPISDSRIDRYIIRA